MASAAIIAVCLYFLDHQLGWIDCWAFEWGDFATLATGAGAVAGAVWVGRKQTKIAERQVEIMRRQIQLDENNLKSDMFERRLETYKVTVDFLMYIGALEDEDEHAERLRLYAFKMQESRFIFAPHVYPALFEIWTASESARRERRNPRGPEQLTFRQWQGWGWQKLNTIHEIFAPDLTIDARDLHIKI